jgi:peptidyl-prolyl cis-trans isomerase A (cyclophilin A)
MRRWGWVLLILSGCYGVLPPPPLPQTKTAPPLAQKAPSADVKAPRGPDSAPDVFQVKFDTSRGEFIVDVHRDWAPVAADHFYQLVKAGYYDNNRFFRIAGSPHIVQWGLNGDPSITGKYQQKGIPDEPRIVSNTPGTIAFAKAQAPNSRTTQLFINIGDNSAGLDSQGFAPFGKVVEGMDVVEQLNDEYGEQPNQQMIGQLGNSYLNDRFPNLDYINAATLVSDAAEETAKPPKSDE